MFGTGTVFSGDTLMLAGRVQPALPPRRLPTTHHRGITGFDMLLRRLQRVSRSDTTAFCSVDTFSMKSLCTCNRITTSYFYRRRQWMSPTK